jgi:hypothetical protein
VTGITDRRRVRTWRTERDTLVSCGHTVLEGAVMYSLNRHGWMCGDCALHTRAAATVRRVLAAEARLTDPDPGEARRR